MAFCHAPSLALPLRFRPSRLSTLHPSARLKPLPFSSHHKPRPLPVLPIRSPQAPSPSPSRSCSTKMVFTNQGVLRCLLLSSLDMASRSHAPRYSASSCLPVMECQGPSALGDGLLRRMGEQLSWWTSCIHAPFILQLHVCSGASRSIIWMNLGMELAGQGTKDVIIL